MTATPEPTAVRPSKRHATGLDLEEEDGSWALAELERIHRRDGEHRLSLPDALGDGVLLRRFAMLENLRREIVARGYRFVSAERLSAATRVLPLLQLRRILDEKEIPYQPTASAVSEVLTTAPRLRCRSSTFIDTCARSYTFHEAAHALFFELVREDEPHLAGPRLVEVYLASEAFAMAVEIMGAFTAAIDPRRSTSIFYALGTYADPFALARLDDAAPGTLPAIGRLVKARPRAVGRCLAAAYLVANLRPDAHRAKPELARRLAELAGLEGDRRATALVGVGLDIDPSFRSGTTEMFFRYLDLGDVLAEVRARPLEASLDEGGAFFRDLERALATVIPDAD